MKQPINRIGQLAALSIASALVGYTPASQAEIDGISGTSPNPAFGFVACQFNIPTPDGGSVPMWGYGVDDSNAACEEGQYPGPTLIVKQGDVVTITLRNNLPVATSLVFPGQQSSAATTSGTAGLFTQEVPGTPTGPVASAGAPTVAYTFTASEAGTYMYDSGSNPALQTEMGLFGAIIVRPTGFNNTTSTIMHPTLGSIEKANPAQTAYGTAATFYDYEDLFLLSEIDPAIHVAYSLAQFQNVDNTKYRGVLWFMNGRNFPNTLSPPNDPSFPHQPYAAIPETRPGEKLLLRLIGASRHTHPFHHHGANSNVIARDGRVLATAGGAALGRSDYSVIVYPGQTTDSIFQWTGKENGWDIYGDPAGDPVAGIPAHTCDDLDLDGFDDTTSEWCADHGVAPPVFLPSTQDLTFGGFYGGSAFLGLEGALPPGEGGLNPTAAYLFAWHSHNEKELVNNDVFPGGMFTALFVHPYPTIIPRSLQ